MFSEAIRILLNQLLLSGCLELMRVVLYLSMLILQHTGFIAPLPLGY